MVPHRRACDRAQGCSSQVPPVGTAAAVLRAAAAPASGAAAPSTALAARPPSGPPATRRSPASARPPAASGSSTARPSSRTGLRSIISTSGTISIAQLRHRPCSSRNRAIGRTSVRGARSRTGGTAIAPGPIAPAARSVVNWMNESTAAPHRRGYHRLEPDHRQLVTRACSSPTTMFVRDTRSSVICPAEPPGPVQSTIQYDVAETG